MFLSDRIHSLWERICRVGGSSLFKVISFCSCWSHILTNVWKVILLFLCVALLELQKMRRISVIYFLYLFIFSGLEFTLTFLTHNRFDFSRYVARTILFVFSWFILELCHIVVFFISEN